MNIKNRITRAENKANIHELDSGMITLELWKDYADGKNISDKLKGQQKQNFAEYQRIAQVRTRQAFETLQKFED